MPRKSLEIFCRIVIPEIIHHQEGIEGIGITKAENAVKVDAGSLHRRAGFTLHLDGADRHETLSCYLGLFEHVRLFHGKSTGGPRQWSKRMVSANWHLAVLPSGR
jgi:hypothetical protein